MSVLRFLRSRTPSLLFAVVLGLAAAFGLVVPSVVPRPATAAEVAAPTPPEPPAGPATLGLSGYQSLLDEYLTVISRKGEPVDTRFDYEKLYDARGRRARMVRILQELLQVPPSRMDAKTRLAWAINLYNFVVLDATTENLLVPNRGRLRHLGVREIRIAGQEFFDAPVITIESRKYSLNELERAFVFGGVKPDPFTPPPPGFDPRPHFALVCGALGCPPLLPRAYRPDSLEAQLDFAVRNALALPRHLQLVRADDRVDGSMIFNWYRFEFGGDRGVVEFLERYAPAPLRNEIRKRKLQKLGGYVDWDWNLNQTEHKKPSE